MKRMAAIAAAVALLLPAAASSASADAQVGIPNRLKSALALDKVAKTATLPLYRAVVKGSGSVWFVITESSDLREAQRLGVNWSPKLRNALGTSAVQRATRGDDKGRLTQESDVRLRGTVDFSGSRVVIPGPDLFPPAPGTHAGPVGDRAYSPLFTFGDGIVYNGPQVANRTGVHGKVVSLNRAKDQVTLQLTAGFYLGRDVLYLSTDSSDTVVAALENATYAPNLAAAPSAGNDDPSTSAREAIIPIVNGPRGVDNPQRQGLQSAVAGEGDPLNIIREEPQCSDPTDPANCSALDYSPLWDVHPVAWTQTAIDNGQRVRLTSHQDVKKLFDAGKVVNAAPNGPSNQDPEIRGLRAAGVVVNCPPIFVALP